MPKVSTIARPARVVFAVMLLSVFLVLTGCGGGGSASVTPPPPAGNNPPPPGGSNPPPSNPETIEGVATPTSVAVVTATNAQ